MKIVKTFFKYMAYFLLTLFLALSCYVVVTTGILKQDYANIFGYTYFQVKTGSMTGSIDVGDIVIVKLTNDYSSGDIITYQSNGFFITHRLIKDLGSKVITKGDVNNVEDDPVDKSQIIGKVTTVISTSLLLQLLALFIIIVIVFTLVNFDVIFKKWIFQVDESFKKRKYKKLRSDSIKISLNELLELQKESDKMVLQQKEIEVLNDEATIELLDDFTRELVLSDIVCAKEQEFLNQMLRLLQVKNKNCKKITFDQEWSIKFCYLYRLIQLFLLDDQVELKNIVYNIPFDEMYDYEFEDVGITKAIQNKLYDMPFYVFLRILNTCMIYNDEYFFDAIFKILKYRIWVDKNQQFTSLSKMKAVVKKNSLDDLNKQIQFMNLFSSRFDKENLLELDKIREYVEIQKKLNLLDKEKKNEC